MGLFKRSRDGPKERRDRSEQMKDFIRGVDVDYIGNSNSGVRVDELRAMQTRFVTEAVISCCFGFKTEIARDHSRFCYCKQAQNIL